MHKASAGSVQTTMAKFLLANANADMRETTPRTVLAALFEICPCKNFDDFMRKHLSLAQVLAYQFDSKDAIGRRRFWRREEHVIQSLYLAEKSGLWKRELSRASRAGRSKRTK